MSKKSSFIKTNKFVPLISDVLPYETPIKFSNVNFYNTINNQYLEKQKIFFNKRAQGLKDSTSKIPNVKEFFIEEYIPNEFKKHIDNAAYTIPYKYKIKKGVSNYRDMSLIHPLIQCEICDFYEEYKNLILFNTNKSSFSLRYPHKIAKIIHRDLPNRKINFLKAWDDAQTSQTKDINEEIIEDFEITSDTQDLISTFFIYKKYSHLFKFYASSEYLDNEKKYLFLTKLDISKFFNSIYTHSISWAIKNKNYTKNHLKDENSFSAKFDKLMRRSNYQETNGIPIGAEVSRIFAEIIMQDIDLSVEQYLKNKGLFYSVKIYRYVDDYFIYYNQKQEFEQVLNCIKYILETYNLFINDSKTVHLNRPFLTKQTIVKEKIKILLEKFLDVYTINEKKDIKFDKPIISTTEFLSDYRILLFEAKVSSTEVCNFVLSKILKKIIFIFDKILKNNYDTINTKNLEKFLSTLVEVIFYLYSISENASATYKLYKINFLIIEMSKYVGKHLYINTKEKILQKVLTSLEIIEYSQQGLLIEQLDLILLLKLIENPEFKLNEEKIKKLLKINEPDKCLSYFEIVVLLDYMEGDEKYKDLIEELLDTLNDNLARSQNNCLLHTENFLLVFDLISCPYLTKQQKRKILESIGIKDNKISSTIKEISKKKWFYNWDEISMKQLLEVKEWTSPYF